MSQEAPRAQQSTLSHQDEQIVFEYYKHQREEMQQRKQERSSFIVQLLIAVVALTVGYSQSTATFIKVGIGVIVIILGLTGLALSYATELSARGHRLRSHEARKRLPFLEDIAQASEVKAGLLQSTQFYYYLLNLLIASAGAFLIIAAFIK